jgi:hypothetical protein
MKRKFKKWWSTISSISTKRMITSHLKIIEITKIQRSHAQSFNFLWTIVWPFVLFRLVIVLSVLIRLTASDCSFCIFKIVLEIFKKYGLYFLKLGFITQMESPIYMGYWCLMPLSTILQWDRFGQFYWWRKLEHQENITNQPEATKKPQTCGIKQTRVYLARGYRTHSFSGGRYWLHR